MKYFNNAVANLGKSVARNSVNNACAWWFYQPPIDKKIIENLKKH